MKKSILFIAMMFIGTIYMSAQEYVYFGVKGGVNFSTFSGDGFSDFNDESARAAYHLGLLAEIPVTPGFSVQPEVLYSAQGFDMIRREDRSDVEYKLDYISVPVLAKFYLLDGLSLEAGPQFSFLVDEELGTGENDIDLNRDNFNEFDFSLGLGASFKLSNFFIYGRYNAGLSDVYDQNADAKHSVIQAGVGILF